MTTSFVSVFSLTVYTLFVASAAQAQSNYEPYSFGTFAGFPPGSADGTGSGAQFNEPIGVAAHSNGNVYVADSANHTVRKITSAGVVTTLAGLAGNPGSADGTGSVARFNTPTGVGVDANGNVYVADSVNHTIRKITPAGVVTTLAGSAGNPGSADGTGSAAQFSSPMAVAVDTGGNVYVADASNSTIRKITSAGVVTTLAGLAGNSGYADGTGSAARFGFSFGIAVDTSGNVYVGDWNNNTVRKITSAGVVTTLAGLAGSNSYADGTGSDARFSLPSGVAVDASGNVYVADTFNNTIRKITSAGVVTTLAGSAFNFGNVDGTGSAARFNGPEGVAVDSSGNVYVGDVSNHTIRAITPEGVVTTLAGSASGSGSADGTGSAARFTAPAGVALDSNGNIYVGDTGNNTIRKITSAGVVTTLAGSAGNAGYADGTGNAAQFNTPVGVAVDTNGNVYVADALNQTIRKITSAGVVTTLAGSAGNPGSDDGIASDARFSGPRGVALDSAGNLYVCDGDNNTIRKIDSAGIVTTLAGLAGSTGSYDGTGSEARFNTPRGVAVDSAGNVYVGDTFNHTIRKITSAGVVTTLAGLAGNPGSADGTVSDARFRQPRGVAVDTNGNVYVGDSAGPTIRKITSAGVVTTLAGSATGNTGSADGTGAAVLFNFPYGVTVDTGGNLYVADFGNNTIRIGNAIVPPLATPLGGPVPPVTVNAGTVGITSVSLTFPEVTMAGTTTVRLINPVSAGSLPFAYELTGAGYGYEISTTAAYTPPIIIAFQVPNVDAATFSQLRVLHNEGGILVDVTASDPSPNPTTRTIYASVSSLSPFVIAKLKPQMTVLPAQVWIGLKNSDDVGTRFDLLAEALKNGTVIGSGQVNGVSGGSSGFNNAVLDKINMALPSAVTFQSGDTLSFRLSVRVAATGHRSGTARLWFNDAAASSRFSATANTTTSNYFLLNGFALGSTAGPGPRKTIDVFVDRAVGGNPFKPFGTWNKSF